MSNNNVRVAVRRKRITQHDGYKFKIGDEVITAQGEIGTIASICNCDRCAERGFYEPIWTRNDNGEHNYITVSDVDEGFYDFYKIGNYEFGYIDKESVLESIDYHEQNLKDYKERLHVLERLEDFEETELLPLE